MKGEHIAKYAKSLGAGSEEYTAKFSKYNAQGIAPEKISEHFAKIKTQITDSFKTGKQVVPKIEKEAPIEKVPEQKVEKAEKVSEKAPAVKKTTAKKAESKKPTAKKEAAKEEASVKKKRHLLKKQQKNQLRQKKRQVRKVERKHE